MTLSRRGFLRILVIAAVLIPAVLISINIFLDRKLGGEAPGYIKKLSKESGYLIEYEEIGIDPLFNLKLSGLTVTDPSRNNARVADVKKITADPGIISSILERRLIVNEVLIQNPDIRTTKDNIQNLLDIINKRDKDDVEKPSRVAVEKVKITDAVYQINPEFALLSQSLTIGIDADSHKQSSEIILTGDLSVLGSRLHMKGAARTGSDITSGVLDISTSELALGKINLFNNKDSSLEADAQINFELSEIFRANGQISVKPVDNRKASSESALMIDYDLKYNPSLKTAALDRFDTSINGLMEGSFTGSADVKEGDVIFDINGSAEARDLSVLKKFVPGLGRDEISGSATARDITISGSGKKREFRLKGEVLTRDINYAKTEDDLGVSRLNCDLRINQELAIGEGMPMNSTGKCTAEKFDWIKTGKIEDISSDVKISTSDNWSKTDISLSGLSGSFMDGVLTGSMGFDLSGGSFKLEGLLTGRDLNLKETPKSVIPFDIEGTARMATANFGGGSGEYDADISFTAGDVLLSLSKGRAFKLSKVESLQNLKFKFLSEDENGTPGGEGKDTIKIVNNGLRYEYLTFGDYIVKNGRVKDLLFSLTLGEDWTLKMASTGNDFEVVGKDISLSQFNENFSIENSGRDGYSGHVKGQGGRFKAIGFPSVEWDYEYLGNFIELSGVKAEIGTIGRFETDNLTLRMGERGGYPFLSRFKDSNFTGLDGKVTSNTISGDFTINNPYSNLIGWEGHIEATKLEVLSQPIKGLKVLVSPSDNGLVLNNISGKFLGGALTGKIDVDTRGPRAKIDTDIELSGASVPTGEMTANIAKADFDFSGLLPQNSLPEGSGKLSVSGISLTNKGKSYTYRGELSGRTKGETLFIEKGFIVGKDSMELIFTGKMMDSLNENRKLELNMPGISIPVAINILRPFLPDTAANAKTQGQADLELIFYNLFYPNQRWGGRLGVLRGAYMGKLSDTELRINEVYGTITIKDDADSENPLSSFVGDQLKLSKSIYKKFLRSVKDFDTSEGSDYLKIGELNYGIIKIENIECQLEVDRNELNLKKLTSKIYRGGLYGAGIYSFQGSGSYNISFLFDEISLEAISKSISSEKDYITGRVNGLAWITGEGGDLNSIDGPFKFWATNSPKEQRKVGEALLDKLGAKERLILGSSRGYDKGDISGYINDGVITFKEFNISNSILGFKNLNIQADPRQNSISINHLISVIRELAKRALTGGPMIETN